MDKNKRELIKMYIYENIKILENTQKSKKDKKVSRRLIKEQVETLITKYLYVKITGTTEELQDLEQDFKEITAMLKSYLDKLTPKTDNEIYKVYRDILFII